MMIKLSLALSAYLVAASCSPQVSPSAGTEIGTTRQAAPKNEVSIDALSDDFDGTANLASWQHVDKTEGWGADQLAKFSAANGWLTMVPHTSTWYMDYRGVLVYKEVPGDFVVTTKLSVTGRDGRSAPASMYSLGGIMVRTPRKEGAQAWQPGGENYVFLSLGSADRPGNYQFEVKTTERSQSNLEKTLAASGQAVLQVAKMGPNIILLRKQGSSWQVHKRYYRADFPATLQVGLTTYTDYPSASQTTAYQHNGTVLRGGNPDLIANFDFVHYRRPKVPAGLDVARASDAELLKFLGDAANL